MYGITPLNDPARLQLLADVGLADVPLDDAFDIVSRASARMLGVSAGLVSIVDSERQYFAGASGLTGELAATRSTPLSHSYCRHVVETGVPLVVGDARDHPVTRGNPAITEYDAIAYAGYPIVSSAGHTIGTVCAVDSRPRAWSADDLAVLRDLARLTALIVDARASRASRTEAAEGARESGALLPPELAREGMAREFLRAIFDNDTTGVLVLDRQGGIIRGNPALERLIGRETVNLMGQPFTELVHPDDRELSGEAFRRLLAGDDSLYPHDERCIRSDGGIVWGRVTASVIRGRNGVPVYALLLMQDITVEKNAQADLRIADADRARAERLRSLGELAAGVAHDFNNALTIITAGAGMVLSQLPEDAAVRVDLHDIEVAARKAAGLSQQLMQFARGQSGRRVPTDLAAIVAEMKGSLVKSVGANITMESRLDESAPLILADKVPLQQILLNLVLNARDAMPGRGRIGISVSGEGNRTVLRVSDTGSGIPPEIRVRLFEPFFTTKGDGKGTGLGLATVDRITRELGGEISVESEVGKGTTFTVSFPAAGLPSPNTNAG